jgi:hypothetical protein
MEDRFDRLAEKLARARVSRRQMLRGMGLGVAGGMLAWAAPRVALADPRTCVICACGTGRPCNVKETFCAEVRGFPAEQTCEKACSKKNLNLCNAGEAFHCPHGCQ